MIPITLIYSHDSIFQGVKEESSQLAIRKADKDGKSLFEQMVFDEAYLTKFRQLFFDAQAQVTPAFSAYMKDIPVEPEYFETQDFTKDRDYTFSLLMPDDFNMHLVRSIDLKIKEHIVSYILYRWLETKLPQEAATYLERATKVLTDARALLNVRTGRIKRWTGYW